jgi:TraY domain
VRQWRQELFVLDRELSVPSAGVLCYGLNMTQKPRTHLRFRIEPQLLARLEKARKESGRTLTAEIAERLNASFSDEVSAGLKDLREDLIRIRFGMMDEIRRELDSLRQDLEQKRDEPQ